MQRHTYKRADPPAKSSRVGGGGCRCPYSRFGPHAGFAPARTAQHFEAPNDNVEFMTLRSWTFLQASLVSLSIVVTLGACSAQDQADSATSDPERIASLEAIASEQAAVAEENERKRESAEAEASASAAAAAAEAQGPDTFQIGETVDLPSATIVVETIERRDEIAASYEAPFTPNPGERLWFVRMRWINDLPEAVGKECHGPYSMDLRAFDIDGREMLMVDQPGYIEGQECSTGLMQGQEGVWMSAFRSLDAEFGWLAFEDYNGGVAAVVADPNVKLSFTN